MKKKNDSLTKRIIAIEDYKSIDIIEKVNNFYDSAWNKLIIILSAAGAITLFLVPYLVARNQQEKLNLKTKEFEEMVNAKVTEMESKIAQFHTDQFSLLKTEIGSTQSDFSNKLNDEIKYVSSFIFLLRGMLSEKEKDYNLFFRFYINATEKVVELNKIKDVKSMISAINQRIDHCVKEKIKINKDTKAKFDKLVNLLNKSYVEELLDSIQEFKEKIEKLSIE